MCVPPSGPRPPLKSTNSSVSAVNLRPLPMAAAASRCRCSGCCGRTCVVICGFTCCRHVLQVCRLPVHGVLCDAVVPPLQVYSGPEVADMAGHLMVYPYHVSETGAITYLGSEFLPDTKTAKVTRLQTSMHQQACRRGVEQRSCSMCSGVTDLHPEFDLFAGAQGLQTCVRWSAGARAEVSDSAMPTDYVGAQIAGRRWYGCVYSWSLHSSCSQIVTKRFLHVLSLFGNHQGISHPLTILCIIEKRLSSILPGSHTPNPCIKPLLQQHAVTPKKNTKLLL